MGVSKPTEMTIRDLLQEELRKRGVTIVPEFSVSTPTGLLKPDILLKNGAAYVVETKLGAETKLLEAMVKLYDYQKYVTEAKGAFAVLFPQELRQPWSHEVILNIAKNPKTEYVVTAIFKDLRPSQRFAGNLSEIADWMAGHVLRAPVVEADTGFAIRVLRDAVSYITASVRQLRGKELEDIFGGKTVFENILQYEEGRYPLEEMRQAATYLLVNQLLFYHVLSRVDASFHAVDEEKIGKPADLAMYFEPVLKRDYSSVFGFDVASRLPVDATEVVKKVVMVVKALAPEKIRHDLLGKVFHELIPFQIRKAVAAFYTNNEAAELLAQLAIDKPDAKVIDLAVGSGTLLVAAYRRKRELLQKVKGTIELEDHKRFLEQDLTGVDIMPFAAHLAVVHLSLQALLYETEKVRVAVWDSTELKPGKTIPAISKELRTAYRRPTLDAFLKEKRIDEKAYIKKGAVTMEGVGGEQISLEQADVVIMNPPFTRGRRLPAGYKSLLNSRFRNYKDFLLGEFGLYGYFILLADEFVREGGRIALVLPATLLRVQSMKAIREFLVKNYQLEYIIATTERAAFSENAQFREILLVGRKKYGMQTTSHCRIITLKKLPKDVDEAEYFAQKMKSLEPPSDSGTLDNELMTISTVSQRDLETNIENLFSIMATSIEPFDDLWKKIVRSGGDRLASLSKYLEKEEGKILRGVENKFGRKTVSIPMTYIVRDVSRAKKSDDVWIASEVRDTHVLAANRFLPKSFTIPKRSLRYGLRRISGVNIIDISNKLDFVLVDRFKDLNAFFGKLKTEKLLEEWKRYVENRLCNLAMAWRFDISASGTSILAYYSSRLFTPTEMMRAVIGLRNDDAKILALWFNSTLNILQILKERVETRGAFLEIPGFVLDKMIVLNPSKLSAVQKEKLLRLFDQLRNISFPSVLEQLKTGFHARADIDKTILGIFGLSDNEINSILDYLYPTLTNEIQQLKTLMQG